MGLGSMDGHDRLRELAVGCLREARDAEQPEIQSLLISMAQIWGKLADEVAMLARAADRLDLD